MSPLRVAASSIHVVPLDAGFGAQGAPRGARPGASSVKPGPGAPPSGPRERRGLVLALSDAEGREGQGEATPLPGFSPDTSGACHRALLHATAALAPIDLDAAPPADAVARALAPLDPALDAVPAARFALETALLDLAGQRLGLPLAECLGGPRPYDEVPVNGLLSAADPLPALLDGARSLAARGVRCVKVKLRARDDAGFARELEALRALRLELDALGDIELRLDPNAAWTELEARARLDALAPLRPRFVEQPVAPDRLDRLGPTAVPWAADESLGVAGLAERLLDAPQGCAAFILKPAALGLLRARRLAVRAQARGLDVVVTHLFDGPIALAAACELALSLPRPPLASGLDDHAGLAAWPPLAIPHRRPASIAAAPGHAGLGLPAWTA